MILNGTGKNLIIFIVMLSYSKVKVNQATNYYTRGQLRHGEWYGQGAIALGLSGEINKKQYLNVMKGKLPSGWKFLTAKKVNPHKRRAATDFTFSTPKSISIQALVMGDTRLIEAHRKAVKTAIAQMESVIETRIQVNKQTQVVTTGNLVCATFEHWDTRRTKRLPLSDDADENERMVYEKTASLYNENPHIHTHCLFVNLTHYEGCWRSAYLRELIKNADSWSRLYKETLASEVKKLGYGVRYKNNGLYELDCYNDAQIKAFSQRREEILRYIDKLDLSEQFAWDRSRLSKRILSPEQLQQMWLEKWRSPKARFQRTLDLFTEPLKEVGVEASVEVKLPRLSRQRDYEQAIRDLERVARELDERRALRDLERVAKELGERRTLKEKSSQLVTDVQYNANLPSVVDFEL